MVFGKAGFCCKLVQAYFSAKSGTEDIHGAGETLVELDARGLPDRWQTVYHFGNITVLLQMIGQQLSQVFLKTKLAEPFFIIRSQDCPDQGVEGRIPTV